MRGRRATSDAIRTSCPYCGVGCGVLATPDGAGGASISADPEHPANFGKLCSKGAALDETLGSAGRLMHPTIGDRRVGWNEALDQVAGGLLRVIADGRLTGAVLIGDTVDALWYLELIRNREKVAAIRTDMMFGRSLALSPKAA